tara:strand:- start:752 stop:976 length:225 start_codon:yes stop_codon:yes gene_type:complete
MIMEYFILKKTDSNLIKLMSGDNLLGDQPLKFYSEEVTETKIELVHRLLILNAQKNSIIDLDRKHKKWGNELAS